MTHCLFLETADFSCLWKIINYTCCITFHLPSTMLHQFSWLFLSPSSPVSSLCDRHHWVFTALFQLKLHFTTSPLSLTLKYRLNCDIQKLTCVSSHIIQLRARDVHKFQVAESEGHIFIMILSFLYEDVDLGLGSQLIQASGKRKEEMEAWQHSNRPFK